MNLSLKSLWSSEPGGWSAIDMQDGMFGVNVRLPVAGQRKPRVLQRAAFPAQTVDSAVLAQMGRTLSPDKLPVVTLLGRHDYQLFMIDKPAVRPDEMDSSLRLAISPLIDYPVAEANLAWLDIPVRQTLGNRVPQLYVVVSRSELIDARKSLFEQARLGLQAVDIRETAQRNISWQIEDGESAVCMLCAEPEGVQLTITFGGELYLVRFISEALYGKGLESDREGRAQAIERLALELQRSFDFVRRNYPSLEIKRVHVAPMAEDLGLVQALKGSLIEDVQSLDLADVFDFPANSDMNKPEVQAQYFHALGSALRIQAKE
jgi:MSHA biogenesis protein MshI